jgi:ABC-type phosphonate transport system ATPase subunit
MVSSEESISDKVKHWLKEEEIQFNRIEESDPDNITFWASRGLKLEAHMDRNKVTIMRIIEFSEKTKKIL